MSDTAKKNASFSIVSEEEAALSKVRKTVFKYLSNIHYFIVFVGLALGAAYLYLKYTNPVYRSAGTVLLVRDDKGASSEKDIIEATISGRPRVNVQDEIELIKSRYLLQKVVERNDFTKEIWKRGRIRNGELSSPYPFIINGADLSDSVDAAGFTVHFLTGGKFKVNESQRVFNYGDRFITAGLHLSILPGITQKPEDNTTYDVMLYNKRTAASKIAGSIKVTPKSNLSRVVELTLTGTNKAKVEHTLQKVMEEYVQHGVDEKKKVQQNTLRFINERLSVLSGELGSVESELESFRRRNNVIDVNSQSQQYLGNVSDQSKDLSGLLVQRQMIDYLLQYLSNRSNVFNLTPTNLGIDDPVLLSLSQSYNQLILEREKELTINTNISPVIKNLEATIEKARFSLLENLKSVRSANEKAVSKLMGERNRAQSEISEVPGKERQLGGILRQEKIKNELFSYLLQKREETEIGLAGAVPEARIFNSSMINPVPISPNRRTTWLMALIAGVAIPLLIIWIKDLLNNKITTRADIVESVATPILGEVTRNTSADSIVVKPASRKVIGEQFRNIRSNINFLVHTKKNFAMLTTSSNPGEGKSFVSINLAATYAISGKRTLLVELDLRKPKLAKYLNIPTTSGFTDLIIGKGQLVDVVKQVPEYENFFVLPAGAIPPNPAELLMGDRMKQIVEELKDLFDVLVFDCPPVGLVSDALIVSPYVDLSVYIIRQRYTLKSQLGLINELDENNRLQNIGIIVNDVKAGGYNGYYGYGSYGYGSYGYGIDKSGNGAGYFETENKKTGWFKKVKI